MKNKPTRWLVGALAWLFAAAALAQDAALERARQLVDSNQGKAAFELLLPLEQQRAGDPAYDYLLGIAANDAGQPTRAVFALERVLAVQPNHPQARAEIARAYFLMGENRAARQEFEAVKRSRPPAEVAATIDRFLSALDARERGREKGYTAYVEFAAGYDNNANAATSTSQFAVPLLPGITFTAAPGSTKESDQFVAIAAGVNGRMPLREALALIGSASIDQRRNSTLGRFDTGNLNAGFGLSLQRAENEFIVALQAQSYSVNDARFRDAAGVVGQWRRRIGTSDQVTGYVQRTRLDYPTQPLRDADRTVVGAAWAHAYGGRRGAIAFAGAYAGTEDERSSGVPEFGHDLVGLRIGGQMDLAETWTLIVSASYEDRRYGGPDPLFLVERHDKEFQLRVAARYALTKDWSLTPQVTYTNNDSNIVVSKYDRTLISVAMRYEFQ